jgi:YD repeat-containing protein
LFGIRRTYISEGATTGSFGSGWLFTGDSRIIRGSTRISEEALGEIERLVGEILAVYEEIKSAYEEATGEHWEPDSEDEGTDGEDEVPDREHWGPDREDEGTDGEEERPLSEEEIAAAIIAEIYKMYEAAVEKLEGLRAVDMRGAALSALNRRVLFPGTPDYYEGVGNERLVLVDENGVPKVYEPAGRGVWLPASYPERLYERIESKDGNGAETRAGFIWYGRGGMTREYNGDGLLIKATEPNGSAVELIRNAAGRIERMEGPHGAAWDFTYAGSLITEVRGPEGQETRYGYSGNELIWVRDADGDTVRYAYENGRLKEIIKPDGSSIKLTYGLAGAGGVLLVTATAHEERAAERFEYDPGQRVTRYTNHSGVTTQYRYDGSHRTTEEIHGSGLVKTYGYDARGQLAWERTNGFETRYGYDGRGNVSEKAYGDGTRERYEWNLKDQITRHVDRDGITTEWTYDGRGNLTVIRRGGVQVFAGTYDERNRLITSREGERAEARYGYDGRDFPVSRTVTVNGQEIT